MNQPTPPDDSTSPAETQEPEGSAPDRETAPTDRVVEETDGDSAKDQPATEAARPVPRSGKAIAVLAFLIAIAAGAGSAYVFWITQLASERADSVRADVSGDVAQLGKRVSELDQQLRVLETEKQSSNSQLDDLRAADGKITARLDTLETSTARLAKRESEPVPEDWRLAEVESLLRIANQQATLARNPGAALAALAEADSLLRRISDPLLQRVRSQVADDILSLQSVSRPDVEGIALRLGSLARRVDALTLAGHLETGADIPSGNDTAGGLARLKAKIADFFGSIFRVRQTEGADAPLLSPQESFFLRRNLELELQAARIAVLDGDTSVYRASISSARRWTEEYFRAEDPGVQAFISALGELEGRQIAVEIPDISGSLEALLATGADQTP
jgi:uroporphyrin-3 C-methyltransferase